MSIVVHFNAVLYHLSFLFVSQLQHYWKFGPDNSSLWGVLLYVGCIVLSLASIHWLPVAPSPVMIVKNTSRHCQIFPVPQNHPQLRMTGLGRYVANSFCSRWNLLFPLLSQLFSSVLKLYLSIVLYSAYKLFILVFKYKLFCLHIFHLIL